MEGAAGGVVGMRCAEGRSYLLSLDGFVSRRDVPGKGWISFSVVLVGRRVMLDRWRGRQTGVRGQLKVPPPQTESAVGENLG